MDNLVMQFLLAGGVVFIFGFALFLLGWKTGKKSRLLILTGIPAQGTVVHILPMERHTYRYEIAFTTQSGEKITANWNVYPRSRFRMRHPEGSQLGVKYLPDNPKQFMVAQYPVTAFSSTVALLVGIGVMALGVAIAMQIFK